MRSNLLIGLVLLLLLLFAPALVTILYKEQINIDNNEESKGININVRIESTGEVVNLELEEYIIGVVAAEMPASYHIEALKAQAVAARTIGYRKIVTGTQVLSSDFSKGQAYLTNEQLKERWGDEYYTYIKKISEAVYTTKGQILVYDDEPIEAVFHAISAGKTRAAGDLWSMDVPYLVSVESTFDIDSPQYLTEYVFTEEEMKNMLIGSFSDISFTNLPLVEQIQIITQNEGGYILKLQIGTKITTGEELRFALNLKSSNITFLQEGNNIYLTTKGYGHGAGMSQYGANGMATNGKEYKRILEHYYVGAKIMTLK